MKEEKKMSLQLIRKTKINIVWLIGESTMQEVYRNTDKQACKTFKKENRKMGKLAIGINYIKA